MRYTPELKDELENCINKMKGPIRIISRYVVPPPMGYTLENENMTNPERIAQSIRKTYQKS